MSSCQHFTEFARGSAKSILAPFSKRFFSSTSSFLCCTLQKLQKSTSSYMIFVISRNFVKTLLHFSTLNLMKLRLSTCQYNSCGMRLQMALWIYYGLFHLCKFQWKCTIDYGGLDAHIIRTIGWCGWNWLYSTHCEKYAAAAGTYFGSKAYSVPNQKTPFREDLKFTEIERFFLCQYWEMFWKVRIGI